MSYLSLPSLSLPPSVRFLFNGDGRAVPGSTSNSTKSSDLAYSYERFGDITSRVSTTPPSPSSTPSSLASMSSTGSSFRLSMASPAPAVTKKSATYDNDNLDFDPIVRGDENTRKNLCSEAYEHVNTSRPVVVGSHPPPVDLKTHPSRSKTHRRSLSDNPAPPQPAKKQELSTAPLSAAFGGSKDSGVSLTSCNTVEDGLQAIDKSLSDLNSMITDLSNTSQQENTGNVQQQQGVGSGEEDIDDLIAQLQQLASDKPSLIPRCNTLPGSAKSSLLKRANSTSTCQPTHYLAVNKPSPSSSLYNRQVPNPDLSKDGYIEMRSALRSASFSVPDKSTSQPPTGAVGKTARFSYDFLELEPIKETSIGGTSVTSDSTLNYQNHPFPVELSNAQTTNYEHSYENIQATGHRSDDRGNHSNYKSDHSNSRGSHGNDKVEATPEPEEDAIYSNHEASDMNDFFSSTFDEINDLQTMLENLCT